MHASEVTPEVAARANDLYWSSNDSVNQIAEELDLSKGALYSAIMPLATGLECPSCGGEAVVPNRTARDRALLECSACAWTGSSSEAVMGEVVGRSPTTAPSGLGRIVVGGALLGAAAGLALVLWTRRR